MNRCLYGLCLALGTVLLAIWPVTPGLFAAESGLPPINTSSPPDAQTSILPNRSAALTWAELAPGLDLTRIDHGNGHALINIVRIDPTRYDFSLHSVQWEGEPARTIEQWAETLDLAVAINAGMYLPDGRTNTGYMRRGTELNNSRIAEKFGGFFVAGPYTSGLPRANVLDRTTDDWANLLPQYKIAVQNFRLVGKGGAQLWPETGPLHAVAAVGVDRAGKILFLHCRTAVTVHRFVQTLLDCPELELAAAMYVEGGAQAAMTVRLPGHSQTWVGQHPADLLFGSAGREIPLPNIIGVRAKP